MGNFGKKVVGFGHQRGRGKDTAAQFFVREYGAIHVSFAHSLKMCVKHAFRLRDDQLFGDAKEVPDRRYSWVKPREILMYVGTELFRERMWGDIWVKNVENFIKETEGKLFVISDVRFLNEAEMIRSVFGGKVVKISGPDRRQMVNVAKRGAPHMLDKMMSGPGGFAGPFVEFLNSPQTRHESEVGLEGYVFDAVVDNSGSFLSLFAALREMYSKFLTEGWRL